MQVNAIPDRFSGLKSYLDSFRALLLEEIRAEMSSNLETLPNNSSSTKHIQSLVRVPTGLRQCPLYRVTISDQRGACAPCIGDIVVLTDTVPRRPSDLASNGRSCCLAHVKDVVNRRTFLIRAAKKIGDADSYAFAASLLAFIPYARIWRCLDYDYALKINPPLVMAVAGVALVSERVSVLVHLLHQLARISHLSD